MQYTRLGNSGLLVSRLAFGTMTFTAGNKRMPSVFKVEQNDAQRLVDTAIDNGVNFFNSADAYANGEAETILGGLVKDKRHDIVIATKGGFRFQESLISGGLSRRYILEAAEASLKRLGTDYIDVYLVHRYDPHTPVEETLWALDTLVKHGKVRYLGFSNWPAWFAAKAVGIQKAHHLAPFIAAELYYSLLGRDIEYDLAPFCEDAGIGIMPWSPLAGGLLTGKYTKQNPQPDNGRLNDFDFIPIDRNKAYEVIDKVRAIGERHRASIAEVALAWLLSRRSVASVLVGASKLSQLESNLKATDLQLHVDDLSALDKLTSLPPVYPHWFIERTKDQQAADALAGHGKAD